MPSAAGPGVVRPAPDGPLAPIREEIAGRIEAGELPSVAMAVARSGEVLWLEGLGWADRERRLPATPRTVYGLASLGKSITATTAMVLAERGGLSLEAPVAPLIAPIPLRIFEGGDQDLTVRHLLDMSAAIPHGWALWEEPHPAAPWSLAELLARVAISVFPPGERVLYSNHAYAVLEAVLEKATGVGFPALVERELFAPLGMTGSRVGLPWPVPDGWAVPYSAEGEPLRPAPALPLSSLGVHSTAADLLRFGLFNLGLLEGVDPLLSDAALRALHYGKANAQALFAQGWGSVDLGDGRTWLLTNGSTTGFTSNLSLIPSQGLVVVCLTNRSSNEGVADELATRVLDALSPGFGERLVPIRERWEAENYRTWSAVPELAGTWRGELVSFEGAVPLALRFTEDGGVHVRVAEGPERELEDPRWEEGLLTGDLIAPVLATVGTDDRQWITLGLQPRGDRLSGFATIELRIEGGRLSLPAYVDLRRLGARPQDAGG